MSVQAGLGAVQEAWWPGSVGLPQHMLSAEHCSASLPGVRTRHISSCCEGIKQYPVPTWMLLAKQSGMMKKAMAERT